jgi:hypothetical protein
MKFLFRFVVWMCLFLANTAVAQHTNHVHTLLVNPEQNTLLMGTHHGLLESRDDGKTWRKRKLEGALAGTDFMAMVAHPKKSGVIYAGGHDFGVVKSQNGGFSWEKAANGLPTLDIHGVTIDPTNPSRLYAWAVGHGLFRSENDALSWSRVDDGPENPHVTFLSSVNISTGMGGIFLYAATAAGLFRSPDCF